MCGVTDGLMGLCLVVLAYLDFRTRGIPVWLLTIFSGLTFLLCALSGRFSVAETFMGLLIGGVFFLISRLTKENIGYGDSWILLLFGIYLGGTRLIVMVFWACLITCLVSAMICARQGWDKKKTMPFIPFLTLAYGLVIHL